MSSMLFPSREEASAPMRFPVSCRGKFWVPAKQTTNDVTAVGVEEDDARVAEKGGGGTGVGDLAWREPVRGLGCEREGRKDQRGR